MKNAILRSTRPLLIAALVAGACNAMAAQRVDLAGINLSAPSQGPKNVLTLTGLTTEELGLQYGEKLNGHTAARLQQYYRGIPVLGEAVVVKVKGDPKNATPLAMSGAVLRNLAQDLPSIKPAISEITALDQAKTLSRTQNTSNEKVNLYIKQGANGAAHLVYVVSFKNDSAATASRPSYLIDATSGAVLDSWEGMEKERVSGPNDSYKKAFETLAQMPGWNKVKAGQVIGLARDLYWAEGSKFSQGACGAEKAAADLGFKVADVSAAFNLAGNCHGNVEVAAIPESAPIDLSNAVFGKMVRVDDDEPVAANGARLTQRATSTGALNSSTGWTRLDGKVKSLGRHGEVDWALNRFTWLLGQITGKNPPRPQSVCFGTEFYLVYPGSNTWNACKNVMEPKGENAYIRYAGSGTYTKSDVYTALSSVPGYPAVIQRNYLKTTQRMGGQILYTQATAVQKNWSVATSAGLKITEKLSVPLVEETSIEVSLGVTETVGDSKTKTITTNFEAPLRDVPAGKAVRYELMQQWQPIRTVWSVPVQFKGYVGADYANGWSDGVNNWHTWAVPAHDYFYEYTKGSEKAHITVDQRMKLTMTIVATIID